MGNVCQARISASRETAAARFPTWFHSEEKCAEAHLKTRAARGGEHYSGSVCVLGLPGASLEITGTSWWWSELWRSSSSSCFFPAGRWLWLVACSFRRQARFYSITELFRSRWGPLAAPQIHFFFFFLSKSKKTGFSWDSCYKKRTYLFNLVWSVGKPS